MNTRLASTHLSLALSMTFSVLLSACMTGEGTDAVGEMERAADAPPADPDNVRVGSWTMHRTCTAVRDCAAERSDCISDWASTCAGCYAHQPGYVCTSYCNDAPACACSGAEGACKEWDYTFVHENPQPDPASDTACRGFLAACHPDASAAQCSTFAATEEPSIAIPAYECAASTGCAPECFPAADDAFAGQLCNRYNDDCDGLHNQLASDAAWWTVETRAAAFLCDDQTFAMATRCVDSFLRVIHPPG